MTFCDWLTLLFIHAKLSGQIGWSWWLVTAPFWGAAILRGMLTTLARRMKLK